MRERTTWTRSAAQNKVADPYLMNQDHVSQQPKADDYVIGDSSTFAEDVHPSKDSWEAEYAGGQVKRNEIGMPEMRKDTFNHPEKTASDRAFLLKKADLCIRTASMMVGSAGETAVEDQAVALMHLPDSDLINTFTRLAEQAQQAQQMQQAQMDSQAQQQHQASMKQQAADLMAQANECMANGDMQAAQDCMAQAQACLAQAQQGQAQVQQAQGQVQAAQQQEEKEQAPAQQKQAQQGEQDKKEQAQDQKGQQVQAALVRKAVEQAVSQVMEQMAQQQMPMAQQQQAQQQMPMAQQQQAQQQQAQQQQAQQQQPVAEMMQADDDATLAELLAEAQGDEAVTSEMGIEMDPAVMDVGDMGGMEPEDDVLMTLFANEQGEEKQQAQQEQGQQKQAMSRTASTRTVGTRPTQGVSRVGGSFGGNGGDVNKLAALWPSAPDVSDAFR